MQVTVSLEQKKQTFAHQTGSDAGGPVYHYDQPIPKPCGHYSEFIKSACTNTVILDWQVIVCLNQRVGVI